MTNNDYEKRILEALDPSAENAHDRRVREALTGGEYLYGLPEPEVTYDDSVRAWAAKESLKGAAERYARAGTTRMSDLHVEQIVSEAYEATNPEWSDLDRLERTATVVNRLAAQNERIAK